MVSYRFMARVIELKHTDRAAVVGDRPLLGAIY